MFAGQSGASSPHDERAIAASGSGGLQRQGLDLCDADQRTRARATGGAELAGRACCSRRSKGGIFATILRQPRPRSCAGAMEYIPVQAEAANRPLSPLVLKPAAHGVQTVLPVPAVAVYVLIGQTGRDSEENNGLMLSNGFGTCPAATRR